MKASYVVNMNGQRVETDDPAVAAQAVADGISARLPMKETAEDREVRDRAYAVAADELRSFVERIEQLAVEKAEVAEQQSELLKEAKGRGYDTKVLRKVVAMRKRKPADLAEEQAVLDMYLAALGMA